MGTAKESERRGRTSPEVEREIRLRSDDLTPFHELVGPNVIAFDTKPSQLRPLGPLLAGTNAIEPLIRRNEVAAGIPHNRNIELLHGFNDIFPKAILVNEVLVAVAWVIQAAVYASAHVLREASIYIIIDLAKPAIWMYRYTGLCAWSELGEGCHLDLQIRRRDFEQRQEAQESYCTCSGALHRPWATIEACRDSLQSPQLRSTVHRIDFLEYPPGHLRGIPCAPESVQAESGL